MKTMVEKKFDTIKFFGSIKEKLAERISNMTLKEQKDFLRQVREGKIKVT